MLFEHGFKLTSYSPKVKKYKSILLKLVLLLYYLCLPVKIYYIHMYTTVTDLVNIYIYEINPSIHIINRFNHVQSPL